MTLDELGILHKTDKASGHHDYLRIYEKYFEPIKNQPISLLEMGYGSYDDFNGGGESAKVWLDYFTNGKIISIDLFAKKGLNDERFQFYQGSQDDGNFFKFLFTVERTPDIIIDDASHICLPTIQSFKILWPYLKQGGLYVIEDIHTSYWSDNYGGTKLESETSTMNFVKRLADHLNHEVNGLSNMDIEFIHFYKEIVFIKKK